MDDWMLAGNNCFSTFIKKYLSLTLNHHPTVFITLRLLSDVDEKVIVDRES